MTFKSYMGLLSVFEKQEQQDPSVARLFLKEFVRRAEFSGSRLDPTYDLLMKLKLTQTPDADTALLLLATPKQYGALGSPGEAAGMYKQLIKRMTPPNDMRIESYLLKKAKREGLDQLQSIDLLRELGNSSNRTIDTLTDLLSHSKSSVRILTEKTLQAIGKDRLHEYLSQNPSNHKLKNWIESWTRPQNAKAEVAPASCGNRVWEFLKRIIPLSSRR